MSPADALVSQVVHMMAKHYDGIRLSWINDIAFLCRYIEATGGWEDLRARATESKTSPLIRQALRIAGLWAGTTVPADLYWTEHASENRVREDIERMRSGKSKLASNIRALWPEEAPFSEKCRIIGFFALPPEQIMRTQYIQEKDMSLPVMHLKRWSNILYRNLRRQDNRR